MLCSLLIGVGFDAYVCFGCAPRAITSKNEALLSNPLVCDKDVKEEEEIDVDEEKEESIYAIKDKEIKFSEFDNKLAKDIELR